LVFSHSSGRAAAAPAFILGTQAISLHLHAPDKALDMA
jgi:hypothetical protein